MSKKNFFWIHIVANVVIIAVLCLVSLGTMLGTEAVTTAAKGNAIYRGNTSKPQVTPMFNVYWGEDYLNGIMDVLDAYGVKTTFFIGGCWAAKNNATVKAIAARGHEIASHGYLHLNHGSLNAKQNEDELTLASKLLYELTGVYPKLFAPPSGDVGSTMFEVCERLDYTVIMWSKDTIDWRDKDANLVYKRATKDIQNGDLVLMHPSAHTLEALPNILKYYKDNGLAVVPVSVNIKADVK